MRRTVIQLKPEQWRALKAAAEVDGVSVSRLVQVAVDRWLAEHRAPTRWALLRSAVGSVRDPGARVGIARRHDEYFG